MIYQSIFDEKVLLLLETYGRQFSKFVNISAKMNENQDFTSFTLAFLYQAAMVHFFNQKEFS